MSNIKGRLTRDAEIKTTDGGALVVNFAIAVNENYETRAGKKVDKVEYFNCAYWGDTDIAELLKKGVTVDVSGWISATAYARGNEHKAQLTMQVQGIKFPFVSKKKDAPTEAAVQPIAEDPADKKRSNKNRGNAAKGQVQASTAVQGKVVSEEPAGDLPF